MPQEVSLNDVKKISFPFKNDIRGSLVAIEGNGLLPFNIERVFYTFGAKSDSVRGCHANKKSNFLIINIRGTCEIRVSDSQRHSQCYTLDKPNEGLYIPAMIWKEMYNYSDDCVTLVLSDSHYDPDEYINSYSIYLEGA